MFSRLKVTKLEQDSGKKEEAEIQQTKPDDSEGMKAAAAMAGETIKDGMNEYLDMAQQNDYEGLDQETLISPEERARKNVYMPLPG